MAYQDYFETVQRLYIAYYQRPADPAGLVYWAKALDWAGNDKEKFYAVVDAFANSEESKAIYGDLKTSDKINAIYKAAFGRDAESGGLAYWTDVIDKGYTTIGRVLWEIIKPGSPSMNDSIVLSNKVQSAMNFTTALDPELDGVAPLATYDANDRAAAKTWLAEVKDSIKTLQDARLFIISSIANAGDPIITQGTSLTTSETDNLVGTKGNDLFIGTPQTLHTLDRIDGGEGTDTLRLIGFTGKTINLPINLTNVETIDIVGNAWGINTFNYPGIKNIIYRDVNLFTGNPTITLDKNQSVVLRNISNSITQKTRTISLVLGTTFKTLDITVDNVNETEVPNNLTVKNIKLNFDPALTTVNLTASGAPSDLTIQGLGANDILNVSGDKDVTLTFINNPDNQLTINALNNSATVTLRLEGAVNYTPASDSKLQGVDNIVIFSNTTATLNLFKQTEGFTITGGSGNDTIIGGSGDDVINGGAGNDIIFGGAGADTINGGAGNDIIYGGAGADVLTGGAGNDKFVFTHFGTSDLIMDFQSGADQLLIDLFPGNGTNGVGTARVPAAGQVRVLTMGGNNTTFTINKTINTPNALTTNQLFIAANYTMLTMAVLAAANIGANDDRAIAFGRTIASNKLYIIYLNDTNTITNMGAFISAVKTIATVGANFTATDILIF